MKNYKMVIAYDGTRYLGWEHQPGKETIQGKLETVIFRMLDEKVPVEDIEIIGAGRTDAGVHAKGMVANVHMETEKSTDEILEYLNRYLPDDISVITVEEVQDRFHSRYNAKGKTYCYTFYCGKDKSVFDRRYVNRLEVMPDIEAMRHAARELIGEHDFAAFCTAPKKQKSTVRMIDRLEVESFESEFATGTYIRITVHGTGFMWNMVRIITGTLLEAGYGRIKPEDIAGIIESRDRKKAGPTAPAQGLCLMKVDY